MEINVPNCTNGQSIVGMQSIPPRNAVAICSYQSRKSLAAFIAKIDRGLKRMGVTFIQLKRTRNIVEILNNPNFEHLILVHSVKDGRFIITDDQDAHYHHFLLAAKEKIGKYIVLRWQMEAMEPYSILFFQVKTVILPMLVLPVHFSMWFCLT